jgi:hypothetical protein
MLAFQADQLLAKRASIEPEVLLVVAGATCDTANGLIVMGCVGLGVTSELSAAANGLIVTVGAEAGVGCEIA